MIIASALKSQLKIKLFGPMDVWIDDHPLPKLRSRKTQWLLALLVLRWNKAVRREWLAGTLWPDVDQEQAFANMRPVLSELRKAMGAHGDRIQSPNRHTLRLDMSEAEVDLVSFDSLVSSAKLADLELAVSLYTGPLLEGCSEEWVSQEREVREQNCLKALQTLSDRMFAAGDYAAAIDYSKRSVLLDPWSDAARRSLMSSYARTGDRNAALDVYRNFVELLRSDPKAVPNEETRSLYARLRSEAKPQRMTGQSSFGEVESKPKAETPGYLPNPLTEIVGREDDITQIGSKLLRSRLVTLIGPGGIGKTRLSIHIGTQLRDQWIDGAWFIPLEFLTEGHQIFEQIASILGVSEDAGKSVRDNLLSKLRKMRLLLILDNCEHLLHDSADAIAAVLRECPKVQVLATSREHLGITGEVVYAIPSLSFPDLKHLPSGNATLSRVAAGYDAVRLFVERASAVQQSFELNVDNVSSVVRICSELQGIPLALELAAANVRSMDVDEIASRLNDHLSLLSRGSRVAPPRHQTLRGTLDWSYKLLTDLERVLLQRLSVFSGGWTLEASVAVCCGNGIEESQIQSLTSSLIDKSLIVFARDVRRVSNEFKFTRRFALLETVRQYAAEKLIDCGNAAVLKSSHLKWCLAFSGRAHKLLQEGNGIDAKDLTEIEFDNIRAALDWQPIERTESEKILLLYSKLFYFWYGKGHLHEGASYASSVLARNSSKERTVARGRALSIAGAVAKCKGDYKMSHVYLSESVDILREVGDRAALAQATCRLGLNAREMGNRDLACEYFRQSLEIHRETNDAWGIAWALANLGSTLSELGDLDAARACLEESLAIRRGVGDKSGIGYILLTLSIISGRAGDFATALPLCQESIELYRQTGEQGMIASCHVAFAGWYCRQGDHALAIENLKESVVICNEIGDQGHVATSIHAMAECSLALGFADRAARLLGFVSLKMAELGIVTYADGFTDIIELKATIRSTLGDDLFDRTWDEGTALSWEAAVEHALEDGLD